LSAWFWSPGSRLFRPILLRDTNGNGVVNLLEFAFNGNPVSDNSLSAGAIPLLPVIGSSEYPDPNDGNIIKRYPTITFTRRTDSPWLSYVVQASSSLTAGGWESSSPVLVDVTSNGMPAGTERATYRGGYPMSGAGMVTPQFLRVNVTAAPH
jgi:hypothetical protein